MSNLYGVGNISVAGVSGNVENNEELLRGQ